MSAKRVKDKNTQSMEDDSTKICMICSERYGKGDDPEEPTGLAVGHFSPSPHPSTT